MRHIILAFSLLAGLYFLPKSEASDLIYDKDSINCKVEKKEVVDYSKPVFSPSLVE